MSKYCCVPSCKFSSKVHPNLSFHEIPANYDLRNEWLKVIPRKDFVLRDYSLVCSRHFKISDFIQHETRKSLKKGTIPSIFSDYPSYEQPQVKLEHPILKRKNEDNEIVACKKSKAISPSKVEQAHLLMDFHNTSTDLHFETAVTTIVPIQNKIENKHTQTKENHHMQGNKETQTKLTLGALNKNHAELKQLRRLLAARNKQIYSLERNLNEARENLSYFKTDRHFKNLGKMKSMLDAGVATKRVEFVLNQVLNFDRTKPRWPENILRECVLFHASSPAGYRHIQRKEILDLPSTRTLQRFLGPANGAVGFESSTKEDLTEEEKELESKEEWELESEEERELESKEDWESLINNEIAASPQGIYNSNLNQFLDSQSETSDI